MNVYIHKPVNYSDMQGPCSEGFHVPSIDEFISLVSMLTTLGLATCTNLKTYLKIPTAGELYYGNPAVNARQHIYLWSSSVSTTYRRVLTAFSTSDAISTNDNNFAGYAVPIRPFKDTVVVPDSTWTALYSDKIYHNSTLGLISISSDGDTWITIADKNLGATNVYNSGDTLSESNCGKYYQRGNNYGFPFDGSATTSGTAIDASNYGPGNYYSSSTFITVSNWDSSNNTNLRGGVSGLGGENELKNAYIGEAPYEGDELCFTANTAGSTVALNKTGSPTSVTLETSTDGTNWSTYTFGTSITLSNIGDKVWFRNTSTTTTGFSTSGSAYYQFVMTGSISASGDVNYLLNKKSTSTVSSFCYNLLFYNCTGLKTTPKLPATTLANSCYLNMFFGCTGLTSLPKLSATTLSNGCYQQMFYGCTSIKLSTTKTGDYQTAYRIPTNGTGSSGTNSLANMFQGSGGTFAGTPSIDTTYYTSNTVV